MNNIISYSEDFERLLKEEAEKAESMSILHNNAYLKFYKISIGLNIPVIIISSVIGFMSPLNLFTEQNIFLGALSIGVAILKTTDNYFNITQRAETHRLTANSYSRFSKWIQLQLSLERECRVNAKDLFDIISNDMQNIREAEPLIPDDVINDFKNKYKDEKTSKPSITNGLTDIKINNNSINKTFYYSNINFDIKDDIKDDIKKDKSNIVDTSDSMDTITNGKIELEIIEK